jgi:hypothetical protein
VEAPTMEPTGGPAAAAIAAAVATRTAMPLVPHRAAMMPARRLRSCGGRSRPPQATTRLPRLLTSTSQLAPPRQVQAFGDHQVRREAGPHPVAQVLRPLHQNGGGNNDTK